MGDFFVILLSAVLVENFVLSKFLGLCPFFGVSKKISTALGMSMAVVTVMVISSALTWIINEFLLTKYELDYLQTVAFIVVIASIVQFLEILIRKFSPPLYKSLGIFLPLITTNCAVLGMTLINAQKGQSFLESMVYGLGAGLGFTLALVLLSGIREKLEYCDIPDAFKGLPITLVSAALISLVFLGFQGLT